MSFRTVYGNQWSEAGWRMCNRDECALPPVPLDFVDTAPIRKGDALTILSAWLLYYDRNIDEITSPVWGWSAENDVPDSNHLAGVAVDINAPKYPWGARTMPAARARLVRHGLDLFEGSVFWGADWSRADEMHFQLAWPEGDTRVAAFAKKLRAGHLGLLGPGNDEEDDMPSAEDIAKAVWAHRPPKPHGTTDATAGEMLAFTDMHAGFALDQLAGPRSKDQRGPALDPTRWEFLGDRSVPEALGLIGAALAIPGFSDPLADKDTTSKVPQE